MKTMCWLEKGKSCGFVQIIKKRPVESLNVERLGEPPLVCGLTWVQSNTECIRQTLRGCAETFTLSGSPCQPTSLESLGQLKGLVHLLPISTVPTFWLQ